jgi:uncharacterized protein YjaZ
MFIEFLKVHDRSKPAKSLIQQIRRKIAIWISHQQELNSVQEDLAHERVVEKNFEEPNVA